MTLDPASKADPAPPPANTISPPAELIPHSDPIDPPPPNENDGDRGLSSAPQDPMDPPLADDGMNHGFPPEGSSFDNNTQQMPMDPPLDPGFTE
jgi:hypothetical protein